jgi:hypothetical protein
MILSCTTCSAYENYLNNTATLNAQRDGKKARTSKEEVVILEEGAETVKMCKVVRDIFANGMVKEDNTVIFNNTIIPTGMGPTFDDPVKTEARLLDLLKRKVNRVEQEHKIHEASFKVCQEIYRRFRAITQASNINSEQKLMILWNVFDELQCDPMELQEAGLDSIVIKQVVKPARDTIVNNLSSDTKNAMRAKKTIPHLPMYRQDSSGSNSSVSSSRSVSSIISYSSSSSMGSVRVMPPPLPPPLPEQYEVTPKLPEFDDVEIKAHDEDPSNNDEQIPQSPFPGSQPDGDVDLTLDDDIMNGAWPDIDDYGSPLPNPL